MATPKMRWRQTDQDELRRITRNYNAKIKREREKLLRQYEEYLKDPTGHSEYKHARYAAAQLPQKASVRDLKKGLSTRKEYKQEIERMQNYIDTGRKVKMDGQLERSLHATVRDFNYKVNKLSKNAKNQGELAALPARLNMEKILRNANNRDELMRDLKEYRKFLEKGAEDLITLDDTKFNIKITKWQKEAMERGLSEVNANRDAEQKAWFATAVKYGGKEAGYTQGQARMDKGDFELRPMTMYSYSSTNSDMKRKLDTIMRERSMDYWNGRTELARLNYVSKLDSLVGDSKIGKKLIRRINSLDLNDFKRTLKGEDDLFLLLYDLEKNPENYEMLLETIWNEWFPDEDFYDWYEKSLEQ